MLGRRRSRRARRRRAERRPAAHQLQAGRASLWRSEAGGGSVAQRRDERAGCCDHLGAAAPAPGARPSAGRLGAASDACLCAPTAPRVRLATCSASRCAPSDFFDAAPERSLAAALPTTRSHALAAGPRPAHLAHVGVGQLRPARPSRPRRGSRATVLRIITVIDLDAEAGHLQAKKLASAGLRPTGSHRRLRPTSTSYASAAYLAESLHVTPPAASYSIVAAPAPDDDPRAVTTRAPGSGSCSGLCPPW